MALVFYKCDICGNLVCTIENSGNPLTCCGRQMKILRPESTDGSLEKHVPVYERDDNKIIVTVGSTLHPMEDMHHIVFIAIETSHGFQVKYVKDYDMPKACFKICKGENLIAIYEYCNLHGLYVKQIT